MEAPICSSNNSTNSDSDSPKVQLCLDKSKGFISFVKSKNITRDDRITTKCKQNVKTSEVTDSETADDVLNKSKKNVQRNEEPPKMLKSASASNFVILSLLDSESGKVIPLQDAMCKGIVDQERSLYKDRSTGSLISLKEAVSSGKAFVRPLENPDCSFTNKVVDNIVYEVKKAPRTVYMMKKVPQSSSSSSLAGDPAKVSFEMQKMSPPCKSFKDLKNTVNVEKLSEDSLSFLNSSFSVSLIGAEKMNGLTVHQALSSGILTPDKITIRKKDGKNETRKLREATMSGVIDIDVYKGLLQIAAENSLENCVDSSSVNFVDSSAEKTAKDKVDTLNKSKINLADKNTNDIFSNLDANTVFVTDLASNNEVISVSTWLKRSAPKESSTNIPSKSVSKISETPKTKSPLVKTIEKTLKSSSPLSSPSKILRKKSTESTSHKLVTPSSSHKTANKSLTNSSSPKEPVSGRVPTSRTANSKPSQMTPEACHSLKEALNGKKISGKVSADKDIERVKAVRFLKSRNVDVNRSFIKKKSNTAAPHQSASSWGKKPSPLTSGLTKSKYLPAKSDASQKKDVSHMSDETDQVSQPITICDALLSDRFDLKVAQVNTENVSVSIVEGVKNNTLESEAVHDLLTAMGKSSLGQLLCLENILPGFDNESIKDVNPISFERSVKEGLLDPATVFYFNSRTGTLESLAAAVSSGVFDLKSGCFVDKETGCKLTISQAVDSGMVKIDFTPSDIHKWIDDRNSNGLNGDVIDGSIAGFQPQDHLSHFDEATNCRLKSEDALSSFDNKLNSIESAMQSKTLDDPSIVEEASNDLSLINDQLLRLSELIDGLQPASSTDKYKCLVKSEKEIRSRYQIGTDKLNKIKLDLEKIGYAKLTELRAHEMWLKKAKEKLVSASLPASCDTERLSKQVEDTKDLMKETAKKKDILAAQGTINNSGIVDKFECFEKETSTRVTQLEILAHCLTSIHVRVDGMDKWIVESAEEVKTLSREAFDESCGKIKSEIVISKLVQCFQQVKSRRPVLNELKKDVDELIGFAKLKKNKVKVTNGENNKHENDSICRTSNLKEILGDLESIHVINEGCVAGAFVDVHTSYHDLVDLLAQTAADVVRLHTDDVNLYIEQVENELNQVFFSSLDPEILSQQLSELKTSHDTLFTKFTSVQEIADKLGPIIQSPGDDELIQVTERLNGVCSKLQTALGLSSAKVDKLEEAVSLAVQLKELQAEVETALLDVESLVEFVEVPTNGNPEEIKNELESSKLAREALTEQLVFVDALVNKSHDLLELLSLEKCQKEMDKPFVEVRMKYDRLNEQLNEKTNGIIQAWRESTTSLADASESFLEELYKISDAVHLTDSISPDMETIRRQIAENKALSENLETCGRSMDHLKKMLVHLHRSNLPDEQNKESQDQQLICDDLSNQLNDLELLQNLAGSNVQIRATKLNEALMASEKYEENFMKTKEKLLELLRGIGADDVTVLSDDDENVEDDISAADEDDIDDGDDTNLQMKSRIEALTKELEEVEKSIKQRDVLGGDLKRLCEDGAEYKVSRDSAVLEVLVEEVRDRIKQRREELDLGEDLTIKFETLHQNVSAWLKETEGKLLRLSSSGVASETRAVKIQIEELKVFMRQLHPHLADLESINHLSDLISKKSHSTSTSSLVTSVMWKVRELSETWNRVVQGSNDREMALTEALVEIGELDQTMDDIIGHMQQVEADIQTLDEAYGDPKYIEAHLKNIEMLLDNVDNQLPSIKKLNERVNKTVLKSCPSTPRDSSTRESSNNQLPSSKLYSKLQELNETYELVHCLARQKKNYLLDSLKEVKDFMKSVEDLSQWLTRHCKQLKAVPLPGALPNTAQNEYNKYMKQHTELERKLDESRMLLFNGEEMKLRCKEDQAVDLQLALVKLEARAYDAHVKSKLEKERLEDHLKKVQVFHAAMNHHDNWMGGAEKDLSLKFKTPSKLLKRVVEQISEHKEFKEEVSQSQGRVHNLDLTGTYLKYFGSKRDASHVKMQLFGSKSRWKRLVMRTEERGRNLQRAYREDHRFFQSWKELNEWLSEVMLRVGRMEHISADELISVSETLKRIQHEFQMKQCSLHSTLRQGRHLRDRCTPIDPEKKVLEEMIDGMREKWREACRSLNMSERSHCERLLESRQVTEACRSVEEALLKFVTELSRDVNLRGDLHAVRTIKEHHVTIFEEIESKKEDTKKLLGLSNIEDTTKSRMQELVIKVEVLYQERMVLIEEALILAQKFNDVVMSSSEKLSQIEQQLTEIPSNLHANFTKEEKFKSILEKLELIEFSIREEEESVKMIDSLCNEILLKPHPSSVGSINYCRSLVDAQFHKLTKSVIHKKKLVEEGLHKTQVDIEVLEDLLTWISDELAILALKENNSIPEDLNTADALFKEHLDFHNELSEKKKIVERFLSSCPSKKVSAAAASSNKQSSLNTISDNPKLLSLHNKWKLIWKVSSDRKRKLQEMFSRLLELRASSKFSFTKWCCRFSSWVRNKRVDLPDFFQLTNRKRDGSLSKKEFIEGLVMLRFQCRVGDLNAAFDELDVSKSGKIHYGDFIQKLSLEPKKIRSQPVTDAEQIHRNIEEQLTHCKCQKRYNINKIADGKYKFGDKGKLCLVRFLNSTVMVRVGGGWVTLPKYLEGNDPCRVRGRTNLELREKYLLPDGGAQTIINFQTRRKSSLASASQSGDSSHQLQSPSSDSCRSSYCSSSLQKNDNKSPSSGSSTPAGRKTPTTSSVRSRTPDYLLNESSLSSSAHSLSHKTSSNRTQTANPQTASTNKTTKTFQGSKVPLSGRTPQNGGKLGGSRTSVGGTSSEGGSPREVTRRILTPRQPPAKI